MIAPLALYGKIALRQRLQVIPEEPLNRAYEATVTAVGPLVDAASGTFTVRLDLPNPDYRLPARLKCRASLGAPSH